jgi:hypothetical protein
MPVINTSAKIAAVHRGITIYHAYKESDYPVDEHLTYSYSLTDGDDYGEFDVRNLYLPDGVDINDHKSIIAHAIDNGKLDLCGQDINQVNPNALSEGQKWLLSHIWGVKNPQHVDDIPEYDNISMEIISMAESCDTPEEVANTYALFVEKLNQAFTPIKKAIDA